jgi:hypothetical protein
LPRNFNPADFDHFIVNFFAATWQEFSTNPAALKDAEHQITGAVNPGLPGGFHVQEENYRWDMQPSGSVSSPLHADAVLRYTVTGNVVHLIIHVPILPGAKFDAIFDLLIDLSLAVNGDQLVQHLSMRAQNVRVNSENATGDVLAAIHKVALQPPQFSVPPALTDRMNKFFAQLNAGLAFGRLVGLTSLSVEIDGNFLVVEVADPRALPRAPLR